MKKIITLITLCLLLTGCSFFQGKAPKKELFVIHIHGEWCKTCSKVDPVIHSLDNYFKNKKGVEYVVFDETSPDTVKTSREKANELGLSDLFEYQRHTGEVLFVDKNTKNVLAVFAGIDEKEKYTDATEKLLNGEEVISVEKHPKAYQLSKPPASQIKLAKVYVIDIHHDKCSTCETTAPIFKKVAQHYKENKDISFFTFDLSNKKTIDETRKLANEIGLKEIYDCNKHTGEVLFIDATTKSIQGNLVAETNLVRYHEIIDMILSSKLSSKT